MLACGIGEGDEVITVPTTFMATAEAITFCGARPVFVDVNDCSYTMDPAELEGALRLEPKPSFRFTYLANLSCVERVLPVGQ